MESNTAYNNNNTGIIYDIDDNGTEEFITPLLGPSAGGVQYSGIIRPGVMVLRKEGVTEDDKKKFAIMSEAGGKWDDISQALGPITTGHLKGKSKLIPTNVDYFTVNKRDCLSGDNADLIMQKYADEDGKLRSIPVWFPINEWWELIPHSLTCFGKTKGIKHKSSFMPVRNSSGRITELKRVCETPEQVEKGRRIFGGRAWEQKDCNPEDCPEYQSGNCKLRGSIQFMIPGISGVGTWKIPTSSYYSLSAIRDTLERVYRITNGRVANIIFRGNTIFVLRKRLATVPSIDIATGEPKMRKQYLINLDLNIDLFELAKEYEAKNMLARGRQASSILTDGNNGNVVDMTDRFKPVQPVEEAPEEEAFDAEVPEVEEAPEEPDVPAQTAEKEEPAAAPEKAPAEKENPVAESSNTTQPVKAVESKASDANGNGGPLPNQIEAIKKLCAKFQIPVQFVDRELKDLISSEKAAEIIKELNKGDLSRFMPRETE